MILRFLHDVAILRNQQHGGQGVQVVVIGPSISAAFEGALLVLVFHLLQKLVRCKVVWRAGDEAFIQMWKEMGARERYERRRQWFE